MYKVIAGLSVLIRQFMLPNPFDRLSVLPTFNYFGVELEIPTIALNLWAEPILYALTFAVTKLYYTKNVDPPIKGSILYLLFYCFHIGVLSIMTQFQFAPIAIALTATGYIGCHIAAALLISKARMVSIYG